MSLHKNLLIPLRLFVLSAAFGMLFLLCGRAFAAQEGEYLYESEPAGAKITRYAADAATVTIPDRLGGANVNSIADRAFAGKSMTSITIPESVTSIGDAAFSVCQNLTTLSLPNRLASIGAAAFGGCGRLTNIVIPPNVSSIGLNAFYECPGLSAIEVNR